MHMFGQLEHKQQAVLNKRNRQESLSKRSLLDMKEISSLYRGLKLKGIQKGPFVLGTGQNFETPGFINKIGLVFLLVNFCFVLKNFKI